ncbi:hypothetical protein [Echinicola sp. 20G]|uniref:hypothetical protein n=1 Tax=Echinicola sp. 20G TaxID=2781961 RepID=UPI001910EFE1|nr:hypothetical protein [Echinicola sp. 20G]
MKTPTWAIIIGICMLLFGGCGMIGSTQAVFLPSVLEIQRNMMDGITKSHDMMYAMSVDSSMQIHDSTAVNSSAEIKMQEKVFREAFTQGMNMFSISEYAKRWTIIFGYLGILVAGFYFLSGIFLLVKLPRAIKMVFIALIISIAFSFLQTIVMVFDDNSGFMTLSLGVGNLFGVVLDVILLIVLLAVDKSTYVTRGRALETTH